MLSYLVYLCLYLYLCRSPYLVYRLVWRFCSNLSKDERRYSHLSNYIYISISIYVARLTSLRCCVSAPTSVKPNVVGLTITGPDPAGTVAVSALEILVAFPPTPTVSVSARTVSVSAPTVSISAPTVSVSAATVSISAPTVPVTAPTVSVSAGRSPALSRRGISRPPSGIVSAPLLALALTPPSGIRSPSEISPPGGIPSEISPPCGIARARALLLVFGFGLGARRADASCAQAVKKGGGGLGSVCVSQQRSSGWSWVKTYIHITTYV